MSMSEWAKREVEIPGLTVKCVMSLMSYYLSLCHICRIVNPLKLIACKDLLTDRKNGDWDTLGILYAIMPDGNRVNINRFFKESENGWNEINIDEYNERIEKHQERIKREMEESED